MLRLFGLLAFLWGSSALAYEPINNGVFDPLPFFVSPQIIEGAKPRYPKTALTHGICGEVHVALAISMNGNVTDMKIIYSDPSKMFDEEVEKVIDSWRFEKKFDNNTAIPYQTVVPVPFLLDDCLLNPSIKRDA